MPLQQSELILRKHLYFLSGGGEKHKNPLELATPVSYTGGAALATKDKFVAHITVKEANNLPLPTDPKDEFVLWRIRSEKSEQPRDFELIAEKNDKGEEKHQKGIPLFWQPVAQEKTKVQYTGHWRVKKVRFEQKDVMGQPRCGELTFTFDRYDERFSRVIAVASSMSEAEIINHDWDAALEDQDSIVIDDDTPVNDDALSKRKRRHDRDAPEDGRAPRPNPAAARVASDAAPSKRLCDFNKHELAKLIAGKGKAFEPLAKTLKDADFNGKRMVEQLQKGEQSFLEFLERPCGIENMLYRVSLMGTFKDNLNEST